LRLQKGFHESLVFEDKRGQRPRLPGELLRVFQRAFEDEPGDRVDVDGGGLTSQPHRLQRNGAAAREGVEHSGRPAAVGFLDLIAEPLERLGVFRFATPMQDAPFGLLFLAFDDLSAGHLLAFDALDHLAADFLAQLLPLFRRARIGQQRGNERRAAGRQWPPRRPDMQRRDMPVPHILFMHAIQRGLLERKGEFNEAGGVGHGRAMARQGRKSSRMPDGIVDIRDVRS
jgi:hypothetical protein